MADNANKSEKEMGSSRSGDRGLNQGELENWSSGTLSLSVCRLNSKKIIISRCEDTFFIIIHHKVLSHKISLHHVIYLPTFRKSSDLQTPITRICRKKEIRRLKSEHLPKVLHALRNSKGCWIRQPCESLITLQRYWCDLVNGFLFEIIPSWSMSAWIIEHPTILVKNLHVH